MAYQIVYGEERKKAALARKRHGLYLAAVTAVLLGVLCLCSHEGREAWRLQRLQTGQAMETAAEALKDGTPVFEVLRDLWLPDAPQ